MSLVILNLTGDPSSSFYSEIGEESISTEGQSSFARFFLENNFVSILRIDFYNFLFGKNKPSICDFCYIPNAMFSIIYTIRHKDCGEFTLLSDYRIKSRDDLKLHPDIKQLKMLCRKCYLEVEATNFEVWESERFLIDTSVPVNILQFEPPLCNTVIEFRKTSVQKLSAVYIEFPSII